MISLTSKLLFNNFIKSLNKILPQLTYMRLVNMKRVLGKENLFGRFI